MNQEAPEVELGREGERIQKTVEAVLVRERFRRLEAIARDPEVRKGMEALLRTAINAGISVADTVPLAGDAASWTADAAKYLAYKFDMPMLDTSPDVSMKIAIGSEALELITAGVVPSHIIETTLQARADWPRMKKAYEATKRIWQGREREIHAPLVTAALELFAL